MPVEKLYDGCLISIRKIGFIRKSEFFPESWIVLAGKIQKNQQSSKFLTLRENGTIIASQSLLFE